MEERDLDADEAEKVNELFSPSLPPSLPLSLLP